MNSHFKLPVLYSFRRCPYAMRARLGLAIAEISVELREVLLRDKPEEMIALSPKATVPVLQLCDGKVLDESLDIMYWAFKQSPQNSKVQQLMASDYLLDALQLIKNNDGQFKANLDYYKYAVRFPEKTELEYRRDCEVFLISLEERLCQHRYLCGDQLSVADISIFPFIRQFAAVDRYWFEASPYVHLLDWLNGCVESKLFSLVMRKYPLWKEDRSRVTIFP